MAPNKVQASVPSHVLDHFPLTRCKNEGNTPHPSTVGHPLHIPRNRSPFGLGSWHPAWILSAAEWLSRVGLLEAPTSLLPGHHQDEDGSLFLGQVLRGGPLARWGFLSAGQGKGLHPQGSSLGSVPSQRGRGLSADL